MTVLNRAPPVKAVSPAAQHRKVLLHWRDVAPQRLGQHFLASAAWRERIARLVLPATPPDGEISANDGGSERRDLWIEIGAGHGEMTSLFAALIGPQRFRAYGNLPYYITSPIVQRLLAQADRLEAAFLVVQLEVGARMTARPGSRDYGYFSAFTQLYSKPEILLRIPPGAFQPPPEVSSALVALHLPGERSQLDITDDARFLKFLKACFAQKRKTLRNNLRSLMPQERATAVLRGCGIALNARAEELGLAQFARLFAAAERS